MTEDYTGEEDSTSTAGFGFVANVCNALDRFRTVVQWVSRLQPVFPYVPLPPALSPPRVGDWSENNKKSGRKSGSNTKHHEHKNPNEYGNTGYIHKYIQLQKYLRVGRWYLFIRISMCLRTCACMKQEMYRPILIHWYVCTHIRAIPTETFPWGA